MKPMAFPLTRRYYRVLRDQFDPARYDGVGSYAPNSHRIPVIDALLYVVGTVLTIWATLGIAHWICG